MIYTVLYSYLLGWAATTVGLALALRKLHDPVRPPSNPIPLAGRGRWPVA